MLKLNITNEVNRLRAVVLGTAENNGSTPKLEDAYDPKSAFHIKNGTYPVEEDMMDEIKAVATVFEKYEVTVYRPEVIENCNQIFRLKDQFFEYCCFQRLFEVLVRSFVFQEPNSLLPDPRHPPW